MKHAFGPTAGNEWPIDGSQFGGKWLKIHNIGLCNPLDLAGRPFVYFWRLSLQQFAKTIPEVFRRAIPVAWVLPVK